MWSPTVFAHPAGRNLLLIPSTVAPAFAGTGKCRDDTAEMAGECLCYTRYVNLVGSSLRACLSENLFPPRIMSGAGFFGIML